MQDRLKQDDELLAAIDREINEVQASFEHMEKLANNLSRLGASSMLLTPCCCSSIQIQVLRVRILPLRRSGFWRMSIDLEISTKPSCGVVPSS